MMNLNGQIQHSGLMKHQGLSMLSVPPNKILSGFYKEYTLLFLSSLIIFFFNETLCLCFQDDSEDTF